MAWTQKEKQAYAIKKRMEAAARKKRSEPVEPAGPRKPLEGYSVHPDNHRCGPGDFLYEGRVTTCKVCGRTWKIMNVSKDPKKEWLAEVVSPITKVMPPSSVQLPER